jgi:hypothetical protein
MTRNYPPVLAIFLAGSLAMLLTGCTHLFAKPPSELDYATTRKSANGVYQVSWRAQVDPVPVRRLHEWTINVTTAAGEPVPEARIAVWGGMPQHGHGLPTKPRVTRALEGSNHLVEGMRFNMGGWWEVKFAIASPAGTDTVTFNLKL